MDEMESVMGMKKESEGEGNGCTSSNCFCSFNPAPYHVPAMTMMPMPVAHTPARTFWYVESFCADMFPFRPFSSGVLGLAPGEEGRPRV